MTDVPKIEIRSGKILDLIAGATGLLADASRRYVEVWHTGSPTIAVVLCYNNSIHHAHIKPAVPLPCCACAGHRLPRRSFLFRTRMSSYLIDNLTLARDASISPLAPLPSTSPAAPPQG
jgi:hypothetical protein